MELLVINDGSKDDTLLRATNWQKKYPEIIRIISKENGGHGSTINVGLAEARGKYVRVVDGDDWVEKDGIQRLVDLLPRLEADIVLTDMGRVENERVTYPTYLKKLSDLVLYNEFNIPFIERFPMACISVKKSLLYGLDITENSYYTDIEFIIYALFRANTFVYVNGVVYMYRYGHSTQSVSRKNLVKNIDMLTNMSLKLGKFYQYNHITDNTKWKIMARRIEQIAITAIHAHLGLTDIKYSRKRLDVYLFCLKQDAPYIYREAKRKAIIKMLIMSKGLIYRHICRLYQHIYRIA
jgi:glycosyltransferase involved in cell wall biosynthesis